MSADDQLDGGLHPQVLVGEAEFHVLLPELERRMKEIGYDQTRAFLLTRMAESADLHAYLLTNHYRTNLATLRDYLSRYDLDLIRWAHLPVAERDQFVREAIPQFDGPYAVNFSKWGAVLVIEQLSDQPPESEG